jgi:hypothetical protein
MQAIAILRVTGKCYRHAFCDPFGRPCVLLCWERDALIKLNDLVCDLVQSFRLDLSVHCHYLSIRSPAWEAAADDSSATATISLTYQTSEPRETLLPAAFGTSRKRKCLPLLICRQKRSRLRQRSASILPWMYGVGHVTAIRMLYESTVCKFANGWYGPQGP